MAASGKNISAINTLRGVPGVVFGDVWYNPGGEAGPRVQRDYQLVIVHLGEARISVDRETVVIPPNRQSRREDQQDRVYKTTQEKYVAAIADIRECYERGQPVLVGTTSIENSDLKSLGEW